MTGTTLAAILCRDLRALAREVAAYTSDEALWRTPPGVANSGGTLALHLLGNLRHYVGARLGGTGYVRDRPSEFARRDVPREAIVAEIETAIGEVERTLASLDDGALAAPYPEAVGGHEVGTEEFLLHVAVHLGYHLGQVDYHRRIACGDGATIGAVAIAELAGARRREG